MKRGRKEKLDLETMLPMFEKFGEKDVNLTEIADIVGIRRESLSRYTKRHPELRHAYKRGRANLAKGLKISAIKTAKEGNPQLLKYLLNNITTYSETPLVDQSQHITQVKYVWNEDNSNPVQPTDLPERDSLKPEQV